MRSMGRRGPARILHKQRAEGRTGSTDEARPLTEASEKARFRRNPRQGKRTKAAPWGGSVFAEGAPRS